MVSLDVEALVDRAARLEQRLRLPRAPLALLEEPRVLDGDARLLGEGLQHALVAVAEGSRGVVRERGDDADAARRPPAAARTASTRMPSLSSTSRRAERGSARTSSTRIGCPRGRGAPDDAPRRPARDSVRHSARAEAVGGRVLDRPVRSALSRPMPQPVLPISAVTERLIVSSTEGRSSRAVMSWLVRLSAASSSARRTLSACSRACSMAEASGRATSMRISTSVSR